MSCILVFSFGHIKNRRVMRRRAFLSGLTGAAAGFVVFPGATRADLACSPVSPGVEACTAGIRSDMASITMRKPQQRSNWCWAACIEMVFRYRGLRLTQERIVEETFGGDVNRPGTPEEILENLN